MTTEFDPQAKKAQMSQEAGPVVVLTNDDGYGEPGLLALERAVESALGGRGEIWVIAPQDHLSGCGHQVSTHGSIELEWKGPRRLAVGGTPADCVRLAVRSLLPRIDWVFSGVNPGGNLGVDVHISGTVAAVREAAIWGIRGVAISHYIRTRKAIDWDWSARQAVRIWDLAQRSVPEWPVGGFWSVNLPHLDLESGDPNPEIVECPNDPSPLSVSYDIAENQARYQGRYSDRPRKTGFDVDVCFSGRIAVSALSIEQTVWNIGLR